MRLVNFIVRRTSFVFVATINFFYDFNCIFPVRTKKIRKMKKKMRTMMTKGVLKRLKERETI